MTKTPSIMPYLALNEHVNGAMQNLPNYNRDLPIDTDQLYDHIIRYIDETSKAYYNAYVKFVELQSMIKDKRFKIQLAQTGRKSFMLYIPRNKSYIALNKRVFRMWYGKYLK